MPRTSNLNIFLRAIPDNKPIGNISLRTRLGWDETKYWKIHRRAHAQGLIALGKGRGGSVIKVDDHAQLLLKALSEQHGASSNQRLRGALGWTESRYVKVRNQLVETGAIVSGVDDSVTTADLPIRALLNNFDAQEPPPLRIVAINGQPFLYTKIWCEPRQSDENGLRLLPKHPGDRAVFAVDNLKGWTLGGEPLRSLLAADGRKPLVLHRERALRGFLDQLFDAAPRSFIAARELFFVLSDHPAESLRDHRRLLARVSRSLWPQLPVRFLRETEMVFEYVRLVRGDLAYTPNTSGIYLVVHCGARQTTFTAILLSPPLTSDAPVTRPVLRALTSVHIAQSGATFDGSLRAEARGQLGLDKDDPSLDEAIEYAKIRVAQIDQVLTLHGPGARAWKLLPKRLRHLGQSTVGSFNLPVHALLERALGELSRNRQDVGPQPILGVILSGGASRTPGIDGALRSLLSLPNDVPVHDLGDQAASAAAVGAMAHILHRKGLLLPPDSALPIAALEFVPTLLDDIHLMWTIDSDPPKGLPIVQREQWPRAYRTDGIATVTLPSWQGKVARVTLGWGPNSSLQDEILSVPDPATPWLPIDCTRRMPELHRMALQNGSQIMLHTGAIAESRTFNTTSISHAGNAITRPAAAPHTLAYSAPGDALVIEFGTAKTLLVAADGSGPIDPEVFALPGTIALPQLPEGYHWDPEQEYDDDDDDDDMPRAENIAGASQERDAEEPRPNQDSLPPDPRDTAQSAVAPEVQVKRPAPPQRPIHPAQFTEPEFLAQARELATVAGLDLPDETLAAVHLAATTRPFVLLAGPPGLGKTTLAGFYASLLGCDVDDQTLLWLAIQAHWISDASLVDDAGGPLPLLCARGHAYPDLVQVALFDEFNLTRPEYYLSRYFSALDSRVPLAQRPDGPLTLPVDANGRPRLLTFATLNIDESSRPPSDKILDRAFLLEPAELQRTKKIRCPSLQPPTQRICTETWSRWCDAPSTLDHPDELDAVLDIFETHANANPSIIHESLSPSRRAIRDVSTFIHRFEQIGTDPLRMTRAQALDRAIVGRILPRLRGEVTQLARLLDPLAELFERQSWSASLRHIKAMKNRVDFGFVSFWG